MIDRIHIFSNPDSDQIRYEFADEDGSIIVNGAIPRKEWKSIESQLISDLQRNKLEFTILDYLVVMTTLLENY